MAKVFLFILLLLCNTAFAKNAKITLTEDNSVVFSEAVTSDYAALKTIEIMRKSINRKPLYLILNTPGGSVFAGLAFIDAVKALGIPVHTVTLFAASMGYQIVQELGTRYITASGTLMSHRGAVSGISGQVPGELNSRIGHISQILDGMASRAASRVKMTKSAYKEAIVNELWTSGEDAVKTKHADVLADVVCDSKLIKGTYRQTVLTIFGQATVVFSKCPLITSPISISFSNGVKEENKLRVMEMIRSRNSKFTLTL